MNYMKFCERCGKGNLYKMPFCTNCGAPLVMGKSLDYPQAKKDFQAYLDNHVDEKTKFENNHFQICRNCHRKCPLAMKFCAWCGAKLNQVDQYDNFRMLMTTANRLDGYRLKMIQVVGCSLKATDDPSESVAQLIIKANHQLCQKCQVDKGNTVIGYHLLLNAGTLIVYGTAAKRIPMQMK